MFIKTRKAEFSKDKRPSRYKAWSEDTVILSIQDPGLMLFGMTCWFVVNLMFGVMILLVQDLHLQWRFVILSIQDLNLTWFFQKTLSMQGLKWRYDDPLDTRSQSHVVWCDPLVHS